MRRIVALILAGMLIAACSGSDGDEPEMYTVAFLRAVAGTPSTEPAIIEELRQAGFEPGRNLRVLDGDADIAYPDPEDARRAVEQWVQEDVDVIFALSTGGAVVAREAAPDTDVLFISNDPTASGLVTDERSPEGNLTGVTFRVPADRTLDVTRRVLPGVTTIGLAYPADDLAGAANRDVLTASAESLGLTLVAEPFSDAETLKSAIATIAGAGAGALVISTSPAATRLLEETKTAADEHDLPVVANTTVAPFAVVSLSPDTEELGRQLGRQAARLLAGTPPSAVPVENPRRFVLVLNEAVAEELGVTLPEDVVREASEVVR